MIYITEHLRRMVSGLQLEVEREWLREAADEIDRLRALVAEREGWKLVPVEPTQKMKDAAQNMRDPYDGYLSPYEAWEAMLDASPVPPPYSAAGEIV